MAVKMAVETTPGAIPRPGRVPKQRLLSPETCLRDGGGYGTLRGISSIVLGFSHLGAYIGERAASEGSRGAHPIPGHAPLLGRAARWCGAPWPFSVSPSVFWVRLGKIGDLVFVSSNSENIARTAFLEPKTTENRNWHLGILLIG